MSVRKHRLGAGLVMVAVLSLPRRLGRERPQRPERPLGRNGTTEARQARPRAARAGARCGRDHRHAAARSEGRPERSRIAALQGAGATVEYRYDDVSYLRVSLPIDRADVVESIDSIQAADVDEIVPLPDPSPEASAAGDAAARTGRRHAERQPVHADRRDRLLGLHRRPPDVGRPRRAIGILDTGHRPSPSEPRRRRARASARSSTGSPARIRSTDNDPTWLESTTDVNAKDGKFTVDGVTYTAPGNSGHFFWSVLNERDSRFTGSEYGNDVNRDGNPAGSSGLFGVIRDGDRVWVDTDQDLSFADETGMRQYSRTSTSVLRHGQPRHARCARPFRSSSRSARDGRHAAVQKTFVNIGIVAGAHGSHVAGIAAGNSLFGGAMSGQAPGAKIVSLRACLFNTGCTDHALTEGMIWIVAKGKADVINMSIGGLPALNDGNNARCEVYTRLVNKKDVQIVPSQGNSGPGVNTAGDPSVCQDTMAMGAYLSRASMQRELRRRHAVRRQPQLLLVARPARGRRLQAAGPRSGLGGLDDADVAAGRPGSGDVHAAARLLDVQRHVDGLAAGRGRGRAADLGREGEGRRRRSTGPAPQGAATRLLATSIPARFGGIRPGQRPDQRPGRVGAAEDEPGDGRHHGDRPGQHDPERVPGDARIGTGIYDREGVTAGVRVLAHVHAHADERRQQSASRSTSAGSATTARSARRRRSRSRRTSPRRSWSTSTRHVG